MSDEGSKQIERDGRTFIIKKFGVSVGFKWASRVFGSIGLSGFAAGGKFDEKIGDFFYKGEKETEELQRDCLSHVFYQLPDSDKIIPVWNKVTGTPGVDKIDGPLAFDLAMISFTHSIFDFFPKTFLDDLKDSLPESLKMDGNVNTSISQS